MARPRKKTKMYHPPILRAIRESMWLGIEQLSYLSGVDTHIIYRAEAGKVIRDDKIIKICKALNLPSDILFYSLGIIPKELKELIKSDPIYFNQIIENYRKNLEELKESSSPVNLTVECIKQINSQVVDMKALQKENCSAEINKILTSF